MNMFDPDFDPYEILQEVAQESSFHAQNIQRLSILGARTAKEIERLTKYFSELVEYMESLEDRVKQLEEIVQSDELSKDI